jgi:ribonuclease HI
MSTRMNWSRRKAVFVPWYADLSRDPFGQKLARRSARPVVAKTAEPEPPKQPTAKPSLIPRLIPPTVHTGRFSGKPVIRTSDVSAARVALSGAIEASVWCDGGCAPTNPGPMGWGVVILTEEIRVEMHGGAGQLGTNNRAELAAAIMALEALPGGCRSTVTGDSTYLVNGMNRWCHSWRASNFQRNGIDIPNAASWRQLDALASGRSIKWKWIRGHSGNAMNELADKLATLGRTGGRNGVVR